MQTPIYKTEAAELALLRSDLEYAADWQFGVGADGLGDEDLGLEILQAGVEFFKGVHLHVAAVGAGALVGEAGDEKSLVWNFPP